MSQKQETKVNPLYIIYKYLMELHPTETGRLQICNTEEPVEFLNKVGGILTLMIKDQGFEIMYGGQLYIAQDSNITLPKINKPLY